MTLDNLCMVFSPALLRSTEPPTVESMRKQKEVLQALALVPLRSWLAVEREMEQRALAHAQQEQQQQAVVGTSPGTPGSEKKRKSPFRNFFSPKSSKASQA